LPETIEELYDTLDAADKHTVFLMGKIEELEAKIANLEAELKAARFAALPRLPASAIRGAPPAGV